VDRAGGVRDPLSDENRSKIRRMLPEALDITGLALDLLKDAFDDFRDEEAMYGNFPSLYMGW
jgi:NAD-reducing hydrogenase large subunit